MPLENPFFSPVPPSAEQEKRRKKVLGDTPTPGRGSPLHPLGKGFALNLMGRGVGLSPPFSSCQEPWAGTSPRPYGKRLLPNTSSERTSPRRSENREVTKNLGWTSLQTRQPYSKRKQMHYNLVFRISKCYSEASNHIYIHENP